MKRRCSEATKVHAEAGTPLSGTKHTKVLRRASGTQWTPVRQQWTSFPLPNDCGGGVGRAGCP
eukprot:1651887-Prymnesium_polylepis.1